MTAYEELLALAGRRHALVEAGTYDDLAAIDDEWDRLVGALPSQPPHTAASALVELAQVVGATQELVVKRLHATADELAATRRGRLVARSYGSTPMPSIDTAA
jgi:hypothetical protein